MRAVRNNPERWKWSRLRAPGRGRSRDFTLVLGAVGIALMVPLIQGEVPALIPKPADLPAQAAFPDPLVMLDGRKVTDREMWVRERKPELLGLFQHYMYGRLPPKPAAVSGEVERVDGAALGGKAH